MFVLLCGYPPFFGDSDAEVLAKAQQAEVFQAFLGNCRLWKVKTGSYSFNPADWKNVSEERWRAVACTGRQTRTVASCCCILYNSELRPQVDCMPCDKSGRQESHSTTLEDESQRTVHPDLGFGKPLGFAEHLAAKKTHLLQVHSGGCFEP